MSVTTLLQADLPPPFPQMDPDLFRRRFGRAWSFEVVEAFDIGPRLRRVVYTAPDLDQFDHRPGQEVILMLPVEGGLERRHYTIRSLDKGAKRLAVDFVLHGDAPGARHCRSAKAGERLTVLGPRGRHVLKAGADWRLFIGDETAQPAIFAMLEALPAGARADVFLEIETEADRQPLETKGDVKLVWLPRDAPAGRSQVLLRAAEGFEPPSGEGHVYTLGETSIIRQVRQHLIGRGVAKANVHSEGYWRPGRIGGHEHVDD
jgi:NADPH-dependent ferric siderophore reductase